MNSVKLVMISCALAAFSGLSAQNDTTFVANGNPIIKYKYTAELHNYTLLCEKYKKQQQ